MAGRFSRIRYHRIHLCPYDITAPLWGLPLLSSPSPTPLSLRSQARNRKPLFRRIHLIPLLSKTYFHPSLLEYSSTV